MYVVCVELLNTIQSVDYLELNNIITTLPSEASGIASIIIVFDELVKLSLEEYCRFIGYQCTVQTSWRR